MKKKIINTELLFEALRQADFNKGNKTDLISEFLSKWIKINLCNKNIQTGEFLPSKSVLAKQIKVSIGTIQNVYRFLEDSNLVESKQCVGTMIKDLNTETEIKKLTSKKDVAVEVIKKYIIKSDLKEGEILPSGRFLSKKSGIASNTVMLALEEMIIKGFLKRINKNTLIITNSDIKTFKFQSLTLVKKVETELKEYITKNFKIGDKLPTHKELAKKLRVSEKTVHDALKPLINDKILISRRGQYGTVIVNMPIKDIFLPKKETSIFATAQETMLYHYEKIQNIIKKMITEKYEIGSKLPSIIEMSQLLDVSPNTVRKSFSILAQEGYITFIKGRYGGTFVTDIPDFETTQAYKWLAVNPQFSKMD